MAALDDVKSWMTYFGWTNGGAAPVAQKKNAAGIVVAEYGGPEWETDLHLSIARCERDKANRDLMDEIEAFGGMRR